MSPGFSPNRPAQRLHRVGPCRRLRPRPGLVLAISLWLQACAGIPPLPEATPGAVTTVVAAVWPASAGGTLRGMPPSTDFVIDTEPLPQLIRRMQIRMERLRPLLDDGTVGLDASGDLDLRDADALDAATHAELRELVANDNADRAQLHLQLARLNGEPRWAPALRELFAATWRQQASAGWWLQAEDGSWRQK